MARGADVAPAYMARGGVVLAEAKRGSVHDDPVVFAIKDRLSLVVGALAAITVAAAI